MTDSEVKTAAISRGVRMEDAEHWRANHDEAVRRKRIKDDIIRELRERLANAEKALEPFAMEADGWSEDQNDGFVFDDDCSINQGDGYLTVGHLRAARAHMEKYHGR